MRRVETTRLSYVVLNECSDGDYELDEPGCGCCGHEDKATPERLREYEAELVSMLENVRALLEHSDG